jgi:16S rRNA (guanine527-N7)-methyltransferase
VITGGRRSRRRHARRLLSRIPAHHPPDLSADRERALLLTPVSRETAARLDRFVALLLGWQQRMNLIASSTQSTLWSRHVADSLQLVALAPEARIWADLGSGAGFPGLAIGCVLTDITGARVHLVESNLKKAAFLREAVRATGAAAIVHAIKIAEFAQHPPEPIEVVTARALAPLPKLLALAYPLLKTGSRGLFPKGKDMAAELTEAAKYWKIHASLALSRTDPNARILVVRGLEPNFDPRGKRSSNTLLTENKGNRPR